MACELVWLELVRLAAVPVIIECVAEGDVSLLWWCAGPVDLFERVLKVLCLLVGESAALFDVLLCGFAGFLVEFFEVAEGFAEHFPFPWCVRIDVWEEAVLAFGSICIGALVYLFPDLFSDVFVCVLRRFAH